MIVVILKKLKSSNAYSIMNRITFLNSIYQYSSVQSHFLFW